MKAFKIKKYIQILSDEYSDFWNEKFDENYDLDNIDWGEVKRTLEFSEGKLIGKVFLIGIPIGIVLILIFKIVFDIKTSFQFFLSSGAILIGILQIGLFVIKIILMKKMGIKFTLIRYVTIIGEKDVPLEVSTSQRYSKILKAYIIDSIQTYDNWRDPVKYKPKAVNKDVENRKRMLKKRMIFVGIVVGIVLIVMISMSGYFFFKSSNYDYIKNKIPQNGQMVIINKTTIQNQTLEMRDNLVILSGGELYLDNATLIWNLSLDGDSGFFVGKNGIVTARNSTLKGISAESTFKCEIQGIAQFHNCRFTNLWGDEDNLIGQGGIEIYNDNVLIDRCVISHGKVSGIIIGDCNPIIRNSVITDNNDDGIEIFRASPIIENNTIRNNNDGIMIYDSDPIIIDNHILDNNGRGIGIIEDSDPELTNNTFSNNDEGKIYRSDDSFFSCLILLPIAMILLIIPILFLKFRSEMKKLKQ